MAFDFGGGGGGQKSLFSLANYFPKGGQGFGGQQPDSYPQSPRGWKGQAFGAGGKGAARTGYPWPDVRRGLFDSQQPSGAGGGPRNNILGPPPTPPIYPGPTRTPPHQLPIPVPTHTGGSGAGGITPRGGGAPPWYGPWNTPFPAGGNGTGTAPGPGPFPGQTFPGGNGTVPSPLPFPGPGTGGEPTGTPTPPILPAPPSSSPGADTVPLPPGTEMNPLPPQLLYGILSYLASTPAMGQGAQSLSQFSTPQIQQALAALGPQMPSAWLPQIRAQLYNSPYAALFG